MGTNQQTMKLDVLPRTEFTRATLRQLREQGRVPAVVYGSQTESLPIHVNEKDLAKISRRGRTEIFGLQVENGANYPVLIKDIQEKYGKILHVDFQQVSRNKPVRVKVPVQYTGTAVGTKSGGVFQIQVTELEVEGLPDDLPSTIDVDVTSLDTGDKLLASDLKLPSGITLLASEEELLASIVLPRVVDVDPATDVNEDGEAITPEEAEAQE